jgi:WD40 repeat protein
VDEVGVSAIALSPNGSAVASGSSDGVLRLWDVKTGKVIVKWTGHTRVVNSLCWSPYGKRVLSGSDDGTTRTWDVKSGKTVLGPIKNAHQFVSAVIYSPDSTKFATGGDHKNGVKIWDAKTGELLIAIKHKNWVLSFAWTSNGNKLIFTRVRTKSQLLMTLLIKAC